jgi:RNA polymerase sigma-70 factor, ECF subfamily
MRPEIGPPVQGRRDDHPDPSENVRGWFKPGASKEGIPPLDVRVWFGAVLSTHYRLFYSIAYTYFRNSSWAEDAVHNAALKALRNLHKLKEPAAVVSWFARITRNTCLDELRTADYIHTESLEMAEQKAAPDFTWRRELRNQLLKEIATLPESQAIVVRLRFLEGRDADDSAKALGLRKNTVEVRLHRALRTLSKKSSLRSLKGDLP